MLLQNKVAIVSGVGPGMGRDIALALTREGAHTVLVARSTEMLDRVGAEVARAGGSALTVAADITVADDCARIAHSAVERFGRIDVLVNNAFSIGELTPFAEADLDGGWRQAFEVNLYGSLRLTQRVIGYMRRGDGGSIIMINTVSTHKTTAGFAAYAASKSALRTTARYLAEELGPDAIRVNSVTPGYIMGEALMGHFSALGAQLGTSGAEVRDGIEARLPLRHIPHSSEIADAVVFYASPLSRAVTGTDLDVNCGEYIRG